MSNPQTLAEKVWERHVVHRAVGEPDLLYVDLHLVHEVTSPQAFDALRLAGRSVRRPDLTRCDDGSQRADDRGSRDRCDDRPADGGPREEREGVRRHDSTPGAPQPRHRPRDRPELGYTEPGMTIVCGDSHTSTHGAFGALAFGIGTSEVEHVLATQTLPSRRRARWRSPSKGPPGRV